MKCKLLPIALVLILGLAPAFAQDAPTPKIPATAHIVPKWTATDGEGYFSIIEGHNNRLYIGTHANSENSYLVEFDPATGKMEVIVDAHKAIGVDLKGFASQAKIHTRNNVGASGKIYFGTKQGHPVDGEPGKAENYPGGYPMTYDPATGETKVYPIPVPHQGISSITPDESRGIAYVATCADWRPGPNENSIFLILDLETGETRPLMDTQHGCGFIVVDYLGRAYHPVHGGGIARYNPGSGKLEVLKQTIDGQPPTAASLLAGDAPGGHPLNWDISPDGKTLYAVPMKTNQLYSYDLTAEGDTLPGKSLGTLIASATHTDCRAMSVGPTGQVVASVTDLREGICWNHLITYRPGDTAPKDHGIVVISNPDYTEFTDAEGKPLWKHGGVYTTENGVMTSRYATMGTCETKDGSIYILMLQPYTVLQIKPEALK